MENNNEISDLKVHVFPSTVKSIFGLFFPIRNLINKCFLAPSCSALSSSAQPLSLTEACHSGPHCQPSGSEPRPPSRHPPKTTIQAGFYVLHVSGDDSHYDTCLQSSRSVKLSFVPVGHICLRETLAESLWES